MLAKLNEYNSTAAASVPQVDVLVKRNKYNTKEAVRDKKAEMAGGTVRMCMFLG